MLVIIPARKTNNKRNFIVLLPDKRMGKKGTKENHPIFLFIDLTENQDPTRIVSKLGQPFSTA